MSQPEPTPQPASQPIQLVGAGKPWPTRTPAPTVLHAPWQHHMSLACGRTYCGSWLGESHQLLLLTTGSCTLGVP